MALNQDCWLLTPCRRVAVQCWAGSATPKTPSEPLLPKHPWSSSSQGTKTSGCISLWHSAVLVVQVWGIWVPGKCSADPFLPPPLLPIWGDGTHDANALVMPAPWQCQQLSNACTTAHTGSGLHCVTHSLKRARVNKEEEAPRGRTPSTAASLSGLSCLHSRAGCWAWVLPHFRHAQGNLGFVVVVCPRGLHPGWVSGVTWQQGRGAEVSSRNPGRVAGVWRAAGAAQDVPESLVGCSCRGIYGQKMRSISCAEAKGWGCVSQEVGAASQDLGCSQK